MGLLIDALEGVLATRENQTVGELLRALRAGGADAPRSEIEKALRRHPDRFAHDRSTDPCWRLTPHRRQAVLGIDATRLVRTVIDGLPALYNWQAEALGSWKAAGRRGVIEAVTGAGKTLLGVAAVKEAVELRRSALVLVPTTSLLHQWRAKLWDAVPGLRVALIGAGEADEPDWSDVTVMTVQSAARRSDTLGRSGLGLLVADEAHRYAADTFRKALVADCDWRLGLTATYQRPDGGDLRYLDPYFGGIVFALGYGRALEDRVIAPFEVKLLGVPLDPEHRSVYEENVETASAARQHLIRRFGVPDEPFGEFMAAVARLSRAPDGTAAANTARTYLKAFKAYRTALAETPSKLDALADLAEEIRYSNGTLVFTESIASCEAAAQRLRTTDLRARALHSRLDHDERRLLLHRFGTRHIRALVAPRVLDEGIDVPEADLAIIVAASQSRRQMVQRMGRVIRPKSDDRRARFVILYARDTREDPAQGAHEGFLEEALEVAATVSFAP